MINVLKEVAIIEVGSPDILVRLTNISEGVDGASVFGVTNEQSYLTVSNGQSYVESSNPIMDIRTLLPNESDLNQINSWASNQTEVYVSAITIDGVVLFGDIFSQTPSLIVFNEELSSNEVAAFKVTKKTEVGFNPENNVHQNGFWAGENIIGGVNWGESSLTGVVADGWSETGAGTYTYSSGVQSIDNVGASGFTFLRDVYFPFPNNEITASINVDDIDEGSGTLDSLTISLFFLGADGSQVSGSPINQSISSTGRASVNGTVPADTFILRLRLTGDASSGTVNFAFSDPCVRIGSNTEYTKF